MTWEEADGDWELFKKKKKPEWLCKAPLIIAKTQQDVHQDWILPAQLDVEIDTFGAFQERFASPQKLQNFGKQFFFDNLSQPQGAAAGRHLIAYSIT